MPTAVEDLSFRAQVWVAEHVGRVPDLPGVVTTAGIAGGLWIWRLLSSRAAHTVPPASQPRVDP